MKIITIEGNFLGKISGNQQEWLWESLEYLSNYYGWHVRVKGLHWEKH